MDRRSGDSDANLRLRAGTDPCFRTHRLVIGASSSVRRRGQVSIHGLQKEQCLRLMRNTECYKEDELEDELEEKLV